MFGSFDFLKNVLNNLGLILIFRRHSMLPYYLKHNIHFKKCAILSDIPISAFTLLATKCTFYDHRILNLLVARFYPYI